MASVREAGWEAFQQGRTDEAIRLLTLACQENPTDYEAHLFLGAVYGKAGRHGDAISILTAAVHLQPANAQARYNLGVALEQAGHVEQAIEAFHQAVTLEPNYFKAREAIHRIELAGSPPQDTPFAKQESSPVAPGGSLSLANPNPLPGPSFATPGYYRAPAPVGSEAPTSPASDTETPGFVASHGAAPTALPSHGLLNDYSPSPNAPGGPTAVLGAYSSELPPPNYNDEIDIPGAFKDFWRILATPDRFFREQSVRSGLMSPILIIGIYLSIELLSTLISNGAQGLFGFLVGLVFSPISLAIAGAWMIFLYLISALIIHFLGWLFGNRQDFSMSFRAVVYSDAPRFLVTILVSLYMAFFVMPSFRANPLVQAEIEQAIGLPAGSLNGATTTGAGGPNGFPRSAPANSTRPAKHRGAQPSAPITAPPKPTPEMVFRLAALFWRKFGGLMAASLAFGVVGWVWSTVLLVLAIHRLQRISAGAAIGVVFVMYALAILLVLLIIFGFAGVILAIINYAMHSGGAAAGGGAGR